MSLYLTIRRHLRERNEEAPDSEEMQEWLDATADDEQ